MAQWIEHRIPVPRVGGSSPFRCANNKREAFGLPFIIGTPEGRTRKGGTSAYTGAKLRAGEQFLARGRVHGSPTADGMAVGGDPFWLQSAG